MTKPYLRSGENEVVLRLGESILNRPSYPVHPAAIGRLEIVTDPLE